MEAEPGELTVEDVERLLSLYKDVVRKYSSLCRAVRYPSATRTEPSLPVPKGRDDILLQLEGQAQMIREEKAEVHKVKSFPVKSNVLSISLISSCLHKLFYV